MRTRTTLASLLAAGVVTASLAGCSAAPAPPTTPTPTQAAPATTPSNTGPIGSTLRVWAPDGQGFAEFTVSNVRSNYGQTRVDVTVTSRQGATNTVGEFSALGPAGRKVDQTPPAKDYNQTPPVVLGLDWGGTMVPGETRTGYVDFPTTDVSTIYLSEGLGAPAASWKAS